MTADRSEQTGLSLDQSDHSYEAFASQPFYKDVDQALLVQAPGGVQRLTDFATGTGAIIGQLNQLGKLESPFVVNAVDIDENALAIAEAKFTTVLEGGVDQINFIQGLVDRRISGIGDSSQDLVTFCNAIHLIDEPQKALEEAARILKPKGVLLINSAYVKDVAFPEGTQRIWGMLLMLARRAVQSDLGLVEIPKPVDLFRFSEGNFREMARNVGFEQIETSRYTAEMNRDAVKAICNYEDFAEGALPGINIECATHALVEAVDPTFDRFKIEFIPRNWMFLIAKKSG